MTSSFEQQIASVDRFGNNTTIRVRMDGLITISCNRGLWSVQGRDLRQLSLDAHHYFAQYDSDGEYAKEAGE